MTKIFANLRLWLLIINCFLLMPHKNAEAAGAVDENQLKAAYLIHLSEFTTWPEDKMQSLPSFNICIAEGSVLQEQLEHIKGRLIKNKPLKILYDIPVKDVNSCHIFYVESDPNGSIFQQISRRMPILTVSSDDGFARDGGIIEYYRKDNNIKMKVNLKALSQSTLMISSKLLRLMDSSF